jgi:hypothetical protein
VAKFKGETPYTPQMILNGEKVMTLKSGAKVQENIEQAAKEEGTEVSVTKASADNKDAPKFEVHVGNLRGANQDKAELWMAVTEDGLRSDVKAGENKGKMLEHAAIVPSLLAGCEVEEFDPPFICVINFWSLSENPRPKCVSAW